MIQLVDSVLATTPLVIYGVPTLDTFQLVELQLIVVEFSSSFSLVTKIKENSCNTERTAVNVIYLPHKENCEKGLDYTAGVFGCFCSTGPYFK